MDINARIYWQPGMELNAETFRNYDENLDVRQQASIRAALGINIGILPGAEFECSGMFVNGSFEIPRLRCQALLPSGWVLDIDSAVTVPVPNLQGEKYFYVGANFGTEFVHFQKEGVPFVRPDYSFGIYTKKQLLEEPAFPVARLSVSGEELNIDTEYIPPYLIMASEPRLKQMLDHLINEMVGIVNHPNLEPGDKARTMQRYLFRLTSFDCNYTVLDFLQLTREIASAMNYLIFGPQKKEIDIPAYSQYDVQLWFEWLKQVFVDAVKVLDEIVLVDDSIDYEKLKRELREEITENIRQEVYPEMNRLLAESVERMRTEMTEQLRTTLKGYIDGTLHPELYQRLHEELDEPLRRELYQRLYEDLYNALYVPAAAPEDDVFTPLI